ncbi:hypothetical protein [Burkholderia cenocepacia]|uniref:hypothetical protein n=1 Tax=Burkholderia cenocepacia TaxID=95486 RepID=UPI001237143C|nr:hypothetical protein [Burkholderia cenocepacia]
MPKLDAESFPSLGAIAQGEMAALLTPDEQADFLAAAATAMSVADGGARDKLLRCLNTGAESLGRRRELAREVSALRAGTGS